LKHVWYFSVFILSTLFILLVPNDEDGDTVFMPIKTNDDDEPVGSKKRK
jgi:hypothetical protein